VTEPETPAAAPVMEAAPIGNAAPAAENAPKGKPRLFSEEWAQAFKEALNRSVAYKNASTKWEAGPLALIMRASPRNGYPKQAAVILDLHKGDCRQAHAIPPHQAENDATFVLEGDFEVWMKVLSGQAQPLPMIMRGKLSLKKGSIMKLLPFTQSAQELINAAQTIS
jgi:putative sterol carrier protein